MRAENVDRFRQQLLHPPHRLLFHGTDIDHEASRRQMGPDGGEQALQVRDGHRQDDDVAAADLPDGGGRSADSGDGFGSDAWVVGAYPAIG